MAVWIRADWLPDEGLEIRNCPADVLEEKSDHPYVSTSEGDVVIDRMFDACMKVRDVYRYKIENDGNLVVRDVRESGRDKEVWEECDLPTIVLLLESPHEDEYRNNRPIAPAMGARLGTTGKNLHCRLGYVLRRIESVIDNGSRIIISNPVQFQTSLHMILNERIMNRKVRDAVWNALWCHPYIWNCFESRMRDYKPYIIINACTGGENPEGLKRKVSDFLQQAQICENVYKIYHPSYWYDWDKHEWRNLQLVRSRPRDY